MEIENIKSNRPVVDCESEQPTYYIVFVYELGRRRPENIHSNETEMNDKYTTISGYSNPLSFGKDHENTYPKHAILAMKYLAHSGTKRSECGNRHFDGKQVPKMYYCPIGFRPQEIEWYTQFFSIPSDGKSMTSLSPL